VTVACSGTTRKSTPCPRRAGPSGCCALHDPAEASVRGCTGRARQPEARRAEWEARARELAVDTVPALRALLLEAARMAYVAGDTAPVVRVVSVGAELIKVHDLKAEVAGLCRIVLERVPGAASRLGATQ
jgi:hypothetical protein